MDELTELLKSILAFLPEKIRGPLAALVVASPFITRAIYALMRGGGVVGVFKSIWLGTNTPRPEVDINRQKVGTTSTPSQTETK